MTQDVLTNLLGIERERTEKKKQTNKQKKKLNHIQQLVNSLLTLLDGLESEVFWGIQIKEKP